MKTSPIPTQQRSGPSAEAPWIRRLGAELFGTLALTFVAAGADIASQLTHGEVGSAARAVAPALLVTAMVYALGDVSGAHYNPIVSLGFALRGLFPPRWLVPYWLAQVAGAVGGAALLSLLFGDALAAGVTEPRLVPTGTAAGIEALLTLFLLTVVLATADRSRIVGPNAALAVGATIALCGLVMNGIEGPSMNPARSFGPALVSGRLGNLWIYVAGPLVGCLLAVVITRFLHGPANDDGKARAAAEGEQDGTTSRETPRPFRRAAENPATPSHDRARPG